MADRSGAVDVPGPPASASVPARGGLGRWIKPLVSVSLYALIFWFTDVPAIARRVAAARFEYVAAGILLYSAGQALSAYRWQLLARPLGLAVSYRQLLSFYFIGMFFNLFLPTVIGGDAVKAWLLARETGAVARSTMSVFMERNLGLLALLTIATVAASGSRICSTVCVILISKLVNRSFRSLNMFTSVIMVPKLISRSFRSSNLFDKHLVPQTCSVMLS
jgi:uncharacterized protein (TIRG00374 family)